MQDQKKKLQIILADIIKEYRLKQHKSISLIANEINLSKSIWSDLEKGIKDPQVSTLWRIAEALNVSLSQIIKKIEIKAKDNINFIESIEE